MSGTQVFINLPVKNLDVSVKFFTSLGFTVNPQFTNEVAACIVMSEANYIMLLTEPFFNSFHSRGIADTRLVTEGIFAFSAESRAEVDRITEAALSHGGSVTRPPDENGFMYSRSFEDPDGHLWEVLWMDPNHIEA